MSYLKEFRSKIQNHDYAAFLKLWEEYCAADDVEAEELKQSLLAVKGATFAASFGRHVERILPLWSKLPASLASEQILQLILDLQTTNAPHLAEIAYEFVEKKYGSQKFFQEGLRMVGLRSRENFQGALSGFALLAHLEKGNFVFHTGGWGIGEIMDLSFVREQLSLEFDYVAGRKDMSFANAFKTLIPVPKDHFLALRFGNPDLLEKKAKEEPVEVIRMLLRDLGPKTAAEIKDELCDLVIPAANWTKWWQNTRAKVKKDTMIATPDELKLPFALRSSEVTHEERLVESLEKKPDANTLIQMVYSFLRDFPETLKKAEFKASLQTKLTEILSFQELDDAQELQIHFFLEDLGKEQAKVESAIGELLKRFASPEDIILNIEIVAFRKRALVEVKKHLADWSRIFLHLLYILEQNTLRDYILTELLESPAKAQASAKLQELWTHPTRTPDAFIWYFQKVMAGNSLPFSDQEGKNRFFEAFLILLSHVENLADERETVKKMHGMLSAGRYAIVRQIMQDASLADVKEFLLLATKCHSLSDHDIKILHSLAEVVHPSINKDRKRATNAADEVVQEIWTTKEGYLKLQQRIQQIATVETVENAKEIEVARSHGDLRENSEFKFALEKRDRLQAELKLLSDQLNKARILTKEDVAVDEVGVGVIVECKDANNKKISYTFLGPWDADPDRNILSFQSKLAQTMKGLSIGDTFQVQGSTLTVTGIRNYFDEGK
ncbi:MAG: GreA/GreB family elongation factor [Simkania sp.]|nr:GreA/GreB family elongation factor [Simkania sp.]